MKNKLIVVIPVWNEERTIQEVLIKLKNYVDEIIIVDDGSSDNTANIAKKHAIVIKHQINKGYDVSISDGFKTAKKRKADIIITMDGDGQHQAYDIPKLVSPIIENQADIVVGKRIVKGRFMEYLISYYSRKQGIDDPFCGMKAYKTDVYEDIGFFDNLSSIGTQLTFLALKRGYRIKNVPIRIKGRKDNSRFGGRITANVKVLIAYLKLRRYLNEN